MSWGVGSVCACVQLYAVSLKASLLNPGHVVYCVTSVYDAVVKTLSEFIGLGVTFGEGTHGYSATVAGTIHGAEDFPLITVGKLCLCLDAPIASAGHTVCGQCQGEGSAHDSATRWATLKLFVHAPVGLHCSVSTLPRF